MGEGGMPASRLAVERLGVAVARAAARREECVADPSRDFTRDRKITLRDLLALQVTWGEGSLQDELAEYFGTDADTPSVSAFCQRRRRLTDRAMPILNEELLRQWDLVPFPGGYRLLAADGTTVPFCGPGDADTRVANGSGGTQRSELKPTMSYDVARRTFEGAVMQGTKRQNEPAALCELVDSTWPGRAPDGTPLRALWLADRNFCTYNVLCHMAEAGASFLIRAGEDRAARMHEKGSTKMPARELDEDLELTLTRSHSKWSTGTEGESASVRYVCGNVRLDVLPPRRVAKVDYVLRVRIVRVALPPRGDPDEDGGRGAAWINLVTDLPRDKFPPRRLADLYRCRWDIELAFRDLKCRAGCRSPKTVDPRLAKMEVWGRAVLHNVCSLGLTDVPEPAPGPKRERRTDRSAGFKAMRRLLGGGKADVEGYCARQSHSVRHGRSAPRSRSSDPPKLSFKA